MLDTAVAHASASSGSPDPVCCECAIGRALTPASTPSPAALSWTPWPLQSRGAPCTRRRCWVTEGKKKRRNVSDRAWRQGAGCSALRGCLMPRLFSPATHVVQNRLAVEAEARGLVGHQSLSLRASDRLAQIGLPRQTELARLAFRRVERNHMVSHSQARHFRSDALHDSAALVTQNHREQALRIVA